MYLKLHVYHKYYLPALINSMYTSKSNMCIYLTEGYNMESSKAWNIYEQKCSYIVDNITTLLYCR